MSRQERSTNFGELTDYVAHPRSSSLQMAALSARLLRECRTRAVPGLEATTAQLATALLGYEFSGHERLHLDLAWSAKNALCYLGRGVPQAARTVTAAQRYLATLRTAGLDAWDLGEYFAARRLATGAGCAGASWFGA